MPTRTASRPPAPGRFGRPPAGRRSPAHRPATRRSTPPSPRVGMRRRPPQKSKAGRALDGLTGLVPGSVLGRAAKPSASGGGKGKKAGLALLAGAAGLALKKRNGRKTEEPVAAVDPVDAAPGPVRPDPIASVPPADTPAGPEAR